MTATAAVVVAAALDALVAEPPARIHPVALLGRVVTRVERQSDGWTAYGRVSPRTVGILAALCIPLGFAAAAAGLVWIGAAATDAPWVATLLAAGALFSTTSLRLLLDSARTVIDESDADLDAARGDLPALAGRDPDSLDAGHVRSAAVESLAENLADGLVAPLFAFALAAAAASANGPIATTEAAGALAPTTASGAVDTLVPTAPAGATDTLPLVAGAGAAAWVKAVNTLDSMVGYRSVPIGWAPARLDDLVMWLPARLTALLLAVVAGAPTLPFDAQIRTLARQPSSPNSGWPMATMAALLPARLRKPGAYELDPARSGSATLPDVASATRAVRITRGAGTLAFALAGVIAWY